MTNEAILAAIDEEITKLQQARALIHGVSNPVAKKGPGRPKKLTSTVPAKAAPAKRQMSEEARARIAAAQKKRWAKTRKAAQ